MDSAEHLNGRAHDDVAGRLRIDGEIQPRWIDVFAGVAIGSIAERGIERELRADRLRTVARNPALEGGQDIFRGTPLPVTDLSNFHLGERSGQ